MKRRTVIGLARYGTIAALGALLLAAYYLYSFTYFWLDDFNNVYWVRREGFLLMVGHLLDPTSTFFRPVGMWIYWILFRTAGLHPLPYYLVTFTLHALNAALLFALLRRATRSHYAAGLATLFFVFRTNFDNIYWNFAHIFELMAFGIVLAGILLYIRFGYSFKETLVLTVIYIFAIKAKEQAIALPAMWLAYEWFVVRNGPSLAKRPQLRQLALRYAIFAAVGLWFVYLKVATMGTPDPGGHYYMDLNILTFGRGYGWYFNNLYQTDLRWGAWFIFSFLLAVVFGFTRNGWGLFFMVATYTSLLPFVFMVNHRFELYWYMPFIGVAGLCALAFHALQKLSRSIIPRKAAPIVFSVVFACVVAAQFRHEESRGRIGREYFARLLGEYKSFFHDLRALALESRDLTTIYYRTAPEHMDADTLMRATQFALERTDVDAKIVSSCPPDSMCMEFRDGRLQQLR